MPIEKSVLLRPNAFDICRDTFPGMGLLVPEDETFLAWEYWDDVYAVRFACSPNNEALENLTANSAPESSSIEDIYDWLKSSGFFVENIEIVEEVVPNSGIINYDALPDDVWLYSYAENRFFTSKDLDISYLCQGYVYWDGSNWRVVTWNIADCIVVEYANKKQIDLNAWDGSNLSSPWGGRFIKHYAYPVASIDGKPIEGIYLLEEISIWQGVLPAGKLITNKELDTLLEYKG